MKDLLVMTMMLLRVLHQDLALLALCPLEWLDFGEVPSPSVARAGAVMGSHQGGSLQVSLMLAQFPMMSNFVHVLQGSGNGPGSTDLSALIFLFRSALHMFSPL